MSFFEKLKDYLGMIDIGNREEDSAIKKEVDIDLDKVDKSQFVGEYVVVSGDAIVSCALSYGEIDEKLKQKAREGGVKIGYVKEDESIVECSERDN